MGRYRPKGVVVDRKITKKKRKFKDARLIVRNLPFKSTEENVKEYFSKFGVVNEVKLLRRDDKLVGCGFVQFDNKASAAAAIHKTSGREFLGRPIIADWAISKDNFQKLHQQNIKKENEIKQEEETEVKQEVVTDSENEDDISVKEEPKDSDASDKEEESSDDLNDQSEDDLSSDNDVEQGIKSDSGDESSSDDEMESSDDESGEGSESSDEDDGLEGRSGEDVKPEVKKIKKRRSNDVLEGKTVFIKNVPFRATEEELEAAVKRFGPIHYAKICMDPMTEHSKGTAFVKFQSKECADACLASGTDFTLNGAVLDPHPAVPRKEIIKKHNEPKQPSDSRNLYLLKEGVIMAGSKAAEGVSAPDMAKRLEIERWKRQIIKDLGKFVSRNRLVIHNIPHYFDEKRVSQMVKKYCPKEAKIREVRVMRDLKVIDKSGNGQSKGFAFVSFDTHENALAALRTLNNNPAVFKPQKRPIVSFSVESRKAMKIKEMRLEKSKQANSKQEQVGQQCSADDVKTEALPDDNTYKTKNKKKLKRENSKKKSRGENGVEGEEGRMEDYSGAVATPGTKKFMNNFSTKKQALIHRKHMKRSKTKEKLLSKKIPRHERRARKLENMTRPKKRADEDKVTKLVNRYKDEIVKTARKKWYE